MAELWIGKDRDDDQYVYPYDPVWFNGCGGFGENGVGTTVYPLDADFDIGLKPGQKARLIIGPVIDCNPRPMPENVPELWIERDSINSTFIGHGKTCCVLKVPSSCVGGIPPDHVCRIAWDEDGIRLIGTPEPI